MQVEPKIEADFTLLEEERVAANKKRPRFVKVEGWGPQKKAVTGSVAAATAAAPVATATAVEAEPKKAKTEKD
jgi:hypothetical protein